MDLLRAAPGADIVLAAVEGEEGVFVVGGAVRDAFMGRVPRELDLVVEGDALAVARRAVARVGGSLTVHERFGTATVIAEGFSFDLAGARRETYARPGALPDVELGATIREDLARRDFTINAIAIGLGDGEIVEWEGARADLDGGVLRVLHDGSFADDPTRMLRLVRYAARLGFHADAETEALIDPELFDTVTGDRLGNEVRLMLREPPVAWRELERLGLARALFGEGFAATSLRLAGPLGLAACCVDVPTDELRARLDHLALPARERDVVVAAADGYARLHGTLGGSDADLWRTLRRERVETVELLAAAGEPGARRWLDHVRHRKLAIDGRDLVAAGLTGAAVGAGLERATVAMLEGRAPDAAAQLASALSNA